MESATKLEIIQSIVIMLIGLALMIISVVISSKITDQAAYIDELTVTIGSLKEQNIELRDQIEHISRRIDQWDSSGTYIEPTASDLYSDLWEEKEVARWIFEVQGHGAIASPEEAYELVALTETASLNWAPGVDYKLVLCVMKSESDFRADAVSANGACGYMQLIPRWFRDMMAKMGSTDIFDSYDNIAMGANYLGRLKEQHGSLEGALVAYNTGEYHGTSTAYSRKILSDYAQLLERIGANGTTQTTTSTDA